MKNLFTILGGILWKSIASWKETFTFWGEIACSIGLLCRQPKKLRWKNFFYYMDI